jgi:hypothetical protein
VHVTNALKALDKADEDLSDIEWEVLDTQLLPILEVFHDITLKVQGDSYSTISLIRPSIATISAIIQDIETERSSVNLDGTITIIKADGATIKGFKSVWRSVFDAKFRPYLSDAGSSLYSRLALLHPKYKEDRWATESHWDDLTASARSFLSVISSATSLQDAQLPLPTESSKASSSVDFVRKRQKMTADDVRAQQETNQSSSHALPLSLELEIAQYKSYRDNTVTDEGQMAFWLSKSASWPLLTKFALMHFRYVVMLTFFSFFFTVSSRCSL